MSINSIASLPFIGFSIFVLIAETLGYEVVFRNFRISVRKGENVWDLVNIQIMLLSAVVYAGSLTSTAGITFVEGYSWLRPGNAMAPLLGYFFGIPGCIGVALGELFADSFSGYYSLGSIGGFVGNFALAYVPHKVLSDPPLRHFKEASYFFLFGAVGATLLCAYTIAGLLEIIGLLEFVIPIPIIGGVAPPIERLSQEAIWSGLFQFIVINDIPMNLVGGALILMAFGYLSEKGLYWRDRLGLFEPGKSRRNFLTLLVLGFFTSYVIYDLSAVSGVYGKIGRSEDYLANIIGIAFFAVGILGFLIISINAVKGRILSIIMGSRSVDARALEVYFAARREVLKEGSLDEAMGERLATLLFSRILYPNLARLLHRLRIRTFVEDYLRHIMLYMMNSKCSVRKGVDDHSRLIQIEDCVVCKGISSKVPSCDLIVGFLKGLTLTFSETVRKEHPKVCSRETECRATGKELCKIELSWE